MAKKKETITIRAKRPKKRTPLRPTRVHNPKIAYRRQDNRVAVRDQE